jgi:hypothetical protein
MSNAKEKTYKKIEKTLFLSKQEASSILTPAQVERKERWMFCISKKMDDPMISDKDLVNFLVSGGNGAFLPVQATTAYRDIAAISRLFGNIQLAAKNWYRYMIIEGAKEAYAIAKVNCDAKGMSAALDKIGKYTRSDKKDDDFDWDKMIPPSFEPTDDVSVLGDNIEIIENLEERRKELRRLFKSEKFVDDAKIIIDDSE